MFSLSSQNTHVQILLDQDSSWDNTPCQGFACILAGLHGRPHQTHVQSRNICNPGHPMHVLLRHAQIKKVLAPVLQLSGWFDPVAQLHKCGLRCLSFFWNTKSIPAHPSALQPATFPSYSSRLSTATKNSGVTNLITQNKDAPMYLAFSVFDNALFIPHFWSDDLPLFKDTEDAFDSLSLTCSFIWW